MLGIVISDDDVKVELERLDFEYTYDKGVFHVIIPRRRLDVEANVNDSLKKYAAYNQATRLLPGYQAERIRSAFFAYCKRSAQRQGRRFM